jgi:hypothetical protein
MDAVNKAKNMKQSKDLMWRTKSGQGREYARTREDWKSLNKRNTQLNRGNVSVDTSGHWVTHAPPPGASAGGLVTQFESDLHGPDQVNT